MHVVRKLSTRATALVATLAAAGIGAAIALVAAPSAFAATTYHVATNGNDANAGTSRGAAFRTIQHCATVAVAGDVCEIAAGTYRETVTPPRSGSAGAPITFRSAPGARVTIDGTDAVTGWVQDSGNVYRAPVTLAGTAARPYSATKYPSNTDLWANQVFIGSSMVPEAAFPAPSSDPWNQAFITSGWTSTRNATGDCEAPPCNETITGTLTYNSFPNFGDLTGAVAYFAGGWVALSATVTGGNVSASNKRINISFPKSDDHVYPGGGNIKQFRLVGKKAFLTANNQWYYDPAARQLFVRAPNGGVPSNVVAKKRNYAFDLRGRSNINVTDIGMFAATITTDGSSSNNVLDGINGQYLSHWQTAQYDSTLPYAGIYDANHRFDSGVLLHGSNNTIRNSTLTLSAGNGVNLQGSGHLVQNNWIHNVSYGGTYTAGVTLEVGTNNSRILNNTINDTGRDAINMNTNAYPNPGYRNNRIAYNNIHRYAKIAYDLGGIYACCDTSLAGTRIDHNTIHDPVHTGNGMHFDNGTVDVSVDHNVIWGLKSTGNINHGGNGVNFGGHSNRPPAGSNLPYLRGSFTNNTIVSGQGYTIFNYFANAGHVANLTVRNNILDGARPAGQDFGYIAGGNPNDSNNLVTSRSLNNSGTDPLYTNPSGGDYTVRAGSPAINRGVAVSGITDGYAGSAPDIGAYESGTTRWRAGHDFTTVVRPTDSVTPSTPVNPTPTASGSTPPTGTTYKLVNRGTGKLIGIAGGSTAAEATVVQQTDNGSASQQWQLVDAGGGYSTLVNRGSTMVLDIIGESLLDGAAAIQWRNTNGANQQWQVTVNPEGYAKLVNRNSGKVLDLFQGLPADGTAVIQWTDNGRANQQWRLVPV
ncbi:MAG TPA: RICIN domain-containing protein [Micromonosporaceae bacterium]|nr:RICIN domain-containing protein [Micromonosporaceae bacterium]